VLEKKDAQSLRDSFDPTDQRICRLLLNNPIAKTLAVVALAVQIVLPPLVLEGTLNKSKHLGTALITYFVNGASERSGEFMDAIQRGFEAGVLSSRDRRGIVIGEITEGVRDAANAMR